MSYKFAFIVFDPFGGLDSLFYDRKKAEAFAKEQKTGVTVYVKVDEVLKDLKDLKDLEKALTK